MQPNLKKILRALSLEIRHTLEGSYDAAGLFHPGDLETRLNELGVWRERPARPLAELPHLSAEDRAARQVIDAYIAYRAEAGVERADAVAEFVREAAYNWANRLLALRCMEARGIIDEVVLQKAVYGGRSMVHNRLAKKDPQSCAGPDEGLFAVLLMEFQARAEELPELFAPNSPAIALRPSLPALKRVIGLLSGTLRANGQDAASDEVFSAPDALGWAYQYWNSEEKDRVFEKVRTQKGAKIEGADIIPATQLYTEPYMVKFLVQNSLGALWMGMHPDSMLAEGWEYYVKDADRASVENKPAQSVTLLDPACGSGHFLLEAFDLLFGMYQEEDASMLEDEIAAAILNHNLYGIDIDERAVQIAAAALWMKAKEAAPDLMPAAMTTFHHHLVATNIRLPKGKDHLKAFLAKHPDSAPLQPALQSIFEGLEHVNELGSLVQIEELVEKELRYLQEKNENLRKRGIQPNFFESITVQGELPIGVESYEKWKEHVLTDLEQHFDQEASDFDTVQSFFGKSALKGLTLFTVISNKYTLIVANPPYLNQRNMGEFVKSYVNKHYALGCSDLYTSFIEAFIKRLEPFGALAFVTSHTVLFLSTYEEIRRFIFDEGFLSCSFHYGTGVMKELSNPNAQGFCSWVFTKDKRNPRGVFVDVRELPGESTYQKIKDLGSRIFYKSTADFLSLPGATIAYWLPESVAILFNGSKVQDICKIANRTKTGENEKFVRFIWETQERIGYGTNWLIYQKGGEYKTFFGNNNLIIKWSRPYVDNYRKDPNCRVTDNEYTCKDVLTYNGMGQQFCGRMSPPIATYDVQGPALVGDYEKLLLALAVLNSEFGSYIIKALNGSVSLQSSDVLSVPVPNNRSNFIPEIIDLTQEAIKIRKEICSSDLLEYNFESVKPIDMVLDLEKVFLEKKGDLNTLIFPALGLSDSAVKFKLPIETHFEELKTSDKKTQLLQRYQQDFEQDKITVFVLKTLGHRWPKQIEECEPIPTWVDPDGIIPLTFGLKDMPLLDRVRARLLEQFPGGNVTALEHEFAEIMGESLEKWLSGSFFKHHISQFKKRPIAWQFTSQPLNGKGGKGKSKKGLDKAPAFSCLVYYHKLNAGTLTTLKSQYVSPLRQSYETELRTLEAIVLLSPEQSSRRLQLEAWIDELKEFEDRLERCAREGFASPALVQVAVKEPLDHWVSRDGQAQSPANRAEFEAQEMRYDPDLNDGVRVNIAPLQKFGLLAADVLDAKDIEKAIADRAEWRADERRWCREGKLPKPGWWK